MSRKQPDWVFNLNDQTQGIARKLGEGIATRIFPGDQAMLSVVTIAPHSTGTLHSHPQEQWGVLLEGRSAERRVGKECRSRWSPHH